MALDIPAHKHPPYCSVGAGDQASTPADLSGHISERPSERGSEAEPQLG